MQNIRIPDGPENPPARGIGSTPQERVTMLSPLEEAQDLRQNPLPGDGAQVVLSMDYTTAPDDRLLSSIYDIDQQTKALQDEIQRLYAQRAVLLDRALKTGIRQDMNCELREIPGKKFRVLDAERIVKDWPCMCTEAAELEYRRAREKIAKDGPTLKTLEAVMGKVRVDQYCTIKQGSTTYEVIPRGRF
jgi:vacuolar-type H+-ATPase subunit I/STV1